MEDRTLLSTFTVSNTSDTGPGSLRQAILDSDAASGQANTIDFDIPGDGVQTIAPETELPTITAGVLIDGWSQRHVGFAGTPVDRARLDAQAGRWRRPGGHRLGTSRFVCGLDIDNFSQGAGIHITGSGATSDWVYGIFAGTDPTGTQVAASNDARGRDRRRCQ